MHNSISMEYMEIRPNEPFVQPALDAISYLKMSDLTTKDVVESKLIDIINDRFKTNFTLKVIDDNEVNAWVEIPPLTTDHPFMALLPTRANTTGRFVAGLGPNLSNIGGVDLDSCTVSGVFCKIPIIIGLNKGTIMHPKFNARKVLAIILHEVGHYIGYCYFLLNTTAANFVTAAIVNDVSGATNDKQRLMYLKKGAEVLGIDGVKAEEMLTQDKKQMATTLQAVYISTHRTWIRNETGAGIYNLRANEQIADWFATRFNFGVDLAESLVIMNRESGSRASIPVSTLRTANTIATIMYAAITVFGLGLPALWFMLVTGDSSPKAISLYDNPKQRLETLRKYLIKDIRDLGPENTALMKELLTKYDKLSQCIDATSDVPTVKDWLRDKLFTRHSSMNQEVAYQKQIESLLYNEAHVTAAKFHEQLKKQLGQNT